MSDDPRGMEYVTVSLRRGKGAHRETEIWFIWTDFLVCVCYVLFGGPIVFTNISEEIEAASSMIGVLNVMLCQYNVNSIFMIIAVANTDWSIAIRLPQYVLVGRQSAINGKEQRIAIYIANQPRRKHHRKNSFVLEETKG